MKEIEEILNQHKKECSLGGPDWFDTEKAASAIYQWHLNKIKEEKEREIKRYCSLKALHPTTSNDVFNYIKHVESELQEIEDKLK